MLGQGAKDAVARDRQASGMRVSVRPASVPDAGAIAEIYNEGIGGRQATFETAPRRAADFAAPLADGTAPPFLVADSPQRLAGFARVTPYSWRACYAGVGEASVYVARGARGAGVGRRLLDGLAAEAEGRGYWKLVGLLFPENRPSAALCASTGFREVGTFCRHGRLDGRWRDVLVVERLLGEATTGDDHGRGRV
jgi:L-amino acid N-acyltransferase YncA